MQSFGAGIIGALPIADSIQAQPARSASAPDLTLRIQPVTVELAPKRHVKTIGYNGGTPGPVLKVPEGKTISIAVFNETEEEEIVHWHGLQIPSEARFYGNVPIHLERFAKSRSHL